MRKDAADQYLSYKLIDSNQDWKAKWFYISNHHPELPKPSGKQPKHRAWWNTEPTMQEGIQLPELMQKIKALREARLRAEHVAFSFMKRRVQPLMARDTLGYQYTGDEDTSRMLGNEVNDDDIVERLGKIFKDMPPYTPCPRTSVRWHILVERLGKIFKDIQGYDIVGGGQEKNEGTSRSRRG
jgi:hypothetical protein